MYEAALKEPLTMLPLTEFPQLNASGGYEANGGGSVSSCFSPMPTRDHQQDVEEETASIINQVGYDPLDDVVCIGIVYYDIGILQRCCFMHIIRGRQILWIGAKHYDAFER